MLYCRFLKPIYPLYPSNYTLLYPILPPCYYTNTYNSLYLKISKTHILIRSSDNVIIPFPDYLLIVSPVIKDFLENKQALGIGKEIELALFDSTTLNLLNNHINLLPKVTYYAGKKVTIEDKKAVIVHKELYKIISPSLANFDNIFLANLLEAADFLDIRPLVKIYLDEISKRLFPAFFEQVEKRINVEIPIPVEENNKALDFLKQYIK